MVVVGVCLKFSPDAGVASERAKGGEGDRHVGRTSFAVSLECNGGFVLCPDNYVVYREGQRNDVDSGGQPKRIYSHVSCSLFWGFQPI